MFRFSVLALELYFVSLKLISRVLIFCGLIIKVSLSVRGVFLECLIAAFAMFTCPATMDRQTPQDTAPCTPAHAQFMPLSFPL